MIASSTQAGARLAVKDALPGAAGRRWMRLRYAVTFEFTEGAPETVRGELAVANARLGARRAVEAAQRARPNRHWTSLSMLLERSEDEGD